MLRIKECAPPLAGIYHAAAILDDDDPEHGYGPLSKSVSAKSTRSMEPQRNNESYWRAIRLFLDALIAFLRVGLLRADELCDCQLFFKLLALYRRQLGLPALSINLGLLGQYAGMSKVERTWGLDRHPRGLWHHGDVFK